MSQNLIERLRAKPCSTISPPAIELEAADRIEELQRDQRRSRSRSVGAALLKLCNQLDGMKRRLLHTPGTGQNNSYLLHEDVSAYVEEARKSLAGSPANDSIDLNATFIVTLSDLGAKAYNDRYAELRRKNPGVGFKVVKAGEQLHTSLWHLMQVFGPHIHMGMYSPFENNCITPAQ